MVDHPRAGVALAVPPLRAGTVARTHRSRTGDAVAGGSGQAEEGRLSVLIIGLTALLLSVVMVLAVITVVHVQDRRLLSCADRVAAAASGVMDADAYYGLGGGDRRLVPSPAAAAAEAERTLVQLASTSCRVGTGVSMSGITTGEEGVVVTLTATASLPLLPPVLGTVVAPTLVASSSATTR